jgi:hypothetical protein
MIPVYLEIGKKRTFAGAVDWPGWIRLGRDEASALEALFDYRSRYARVLQTAGLDFVPPKTITEFSVVDRLQGNSITDFGAPDFALPGDASPPDKAELQRLTAILECCWQEFDRIVQGAAGKELRKGPRGGGRDLERITRHVLGGEDAYLTSLGWKFKMENPEDIQAEFRQERRAVFEGLAASVRGEIPERSPRGGLRWSPRYFVRRAAWHVLDHAWEIEDRIR